MGIKTIIIITSYTIHDYLILQTYARGMVIVLCMSVFACVCYHASCYVPGLYNANKVPLDFIWHFQGMHCVDFENALFKSFGDIFADHHGLLRFLTSY